MQTCAWLCGPVLLIKQAITQRLYEGQPLVLPVHSVEGDKPIDRHALSHAVRRLRLKRKMAEWSRDARGSVTAWARAIDVTRDTTEALTHHAIVRRGEDLRPVRHAAACPALLARAIALMPIEIAKNRVSQGINAERGAGEIS